MMVLIERKVNNLNKNHLLIDFLGKDNVAKVF